MVFCYVSEFFPLHFPVFEVSQCIIPISIIDFKIGPSLILAKCPIFFYTITSLDALENMEWLNLEYPWVCFLSILKRDIYYISNVECHLILMRSYQHFLLTILGNATKNNVGETIPHIHTTIQGRQLTRKTCLLFSGTLEAS